MNVEVWLSFVCASFIFGLIPGPSVCFTIAFAIKHGIRSTLFMILGQLAANCLQIIVVLFGLSRLLDQSPIYYRGLKTTGAVYLIYLGYRQWTAGDPQMDMKKGADTKTSRGAFMGGFAVCGTNPKAMLYYAALLPQFVRPAVDENAQVVILAATSILIAALVLGLYTMLADSVRGWLAGKRYWKMQNRLSGMLMMGAGIALSVVS